MTEVNPQFTLARVYPAAADVEWGIGELSTTSSGPDLKRRQEVPSFKDPETKARFIATLRTAGREGRVDSPLERIRARADNSPMSGKTLSTDQARTFYDRFGAKQDAQAFYEDPALDLLRAHGEFAAARHVLEFGCGTGRLAETLFDNDLPLSARYSGCDLSPVMLGLARDRLSRFGGRVHLWQSDGPPDFTPAGDGVDRIIAAYVLDVLPEGGIASFLSEAFATLPRGGLLCTTCLTPGTNAPSRLVTAIWRGVFRLRPQIVGGCRPIRMIDRLPPSDWRVRYRQVVTPWAVPSEITVAERL